MSEKKSIVEKKLVEGRRGGLRFMAGANYYQGMKSEHVTPQGSPYTPNI